MYVSAALHLVGLNPDNTETVFTLGQTLKVYVRNYEVIGGIDEVIGKLDSIITSTNEIRLDTSATMASKYTVIPFGLITNIEVVKTEEEIDGSDVATFDNDAKSILTVTIPALLREILNELPDCKCKYTVKEETKEEDGTKDSTEVKDNTSSGDSDSSGDTKTDTGDGTSIDAGEDSTKTDTEEGSTTTDSSESTGEETKDTDTSTDTSEPDTSGSDSTDTDSSDTSTDTSTDSGTTLDLTEGDDGTIETTTTDASSNGNKTIITNANGTTTTHYTLGS